MKDNRSILTGLLVLLLLASHNLFLYCINSHRIDNFDIKAWYNLEILLFIAPLIWMGNSNSKTKKEIEFRKIGWFAISVISLVLALNNLSFFPSLPSPRLQMYVFNGISFAIIGYGLLFSDKNGNI